MSATRFKLDSVQRKELGKAFLNLGNLAAATLGFGEVIAHSFKPNIFLMGFFCLACCFSLAIILLRERN